MLFPVTFERTVSGQTLGVLTVRNPKVNVMKMKIAKVIHSVYKVSITLARKEGIQVVTISPINVGRSMAGYGVGEYMGPTVAEAIRRVDEDDERVIAPS